MSWLIRGLGAFFALIVVYLAFMFGVSERGEVVELITQDANGEQFTTRLWIADLDGAMWLRADSGSGWYQRLVQHDAQRPATLLRGDATYSITSTSYPEMVKTLDTLMASKYGLGGTIVDALGGSALATGIAVKVLPIE
ncbi:MAG: hypothetical protein VXY44_10435 [Pseudomonadota bacterium]|nr:hypothetical protein [Pseudomonadota bacterium]|tara:strand:- start:359 stop:775 length:417 start_codon:yes stop_codon:yes gene_type:complete